ncbi:uncharacterized protein LOC132187916 [Corylus avellana]|uniref:uncharacterized protein LOC132187916 n=1 Tax=Corylus avellana TaxID=13451 RepID=UPI00286D5DD7|nr:uncharacterized protein LOC132187916 [Corylus avellana]
MAVVLRCSCFFTPPNSVRSPPSDPSTRKSQAPGYTYRYDRRRIGRRNPQTWIAIHNQTDYFFSKRTHVRQLPQSKKGFHRIGEPSLRHAPRHGKARSLPTAGPFQRRRFTVQHHRIALFTFRSPAFEPPRAAHHFAPLPPFGAADTSTEHEQPDYCLIM